MTYTVTVTSKNQLTLPAALVNDYNIKKGDQLIVSADNDVIQMKKAEDILDQLAGSVTLPKKYRTLSSNKLKKQAITDHFLSKKSKYFPKS